MSSANSLRCQLSICVSPTPLRKGQVASLIHAFLSTSPTSPTWPARSPEMVLALSAKLRLSDEKMLSPVKKWAAVLGVHRRTIWNWNRKPPRRVPGRILELVDLAYGDDWQSALLRLPPRPKKRPREF